jgi:hypothetical protein
MTGWSEGACFRTFLERVLIAGRQDGSVLVEELKFVEGCLSSWSFPKCQRKPSSEELERYRIHMLCQRMREHKVSGEEVEQSCVKMDRLRMK